ncbi:efflux transporter outer membrane subunit [Methylobacillus flagellatus]|uniref:RND efflux system, outer membrane lipoprotein, NodT n=1 Tax=Methylobacillus flagellatus (strain ATCC 51484 / DSM 6875 / VKM B-1610 / KT) TaxID=265072 RepID=Q1GYP9_METFK|nr:efflux transporter outer membrane subunit [Methylobacillus flagellatus]ABE50638.1 RND efflux system, outer membrane lipoprotein, NodT [Methylobacillus flagellatus KT]
MIIRQGMLACGMLAVLGGCSFAPELKLPEVPVAQAYKEMQPWVPAAPADQLPRGEWWKLYGDAELDALQEKLVAHSPDLSAALARYQQALAYSEQARADLFPSLSANGQAGRNRVSEHRPLVPPNAVIPPTYSNYSIGLQASYELDLWGRVRNTVKAGVAEAAAMQADLESVRLSLQAQLTDNFIVLRGLDQQLHILEETVQANDKALSITKARHEGGIVPGLDVSRAEAQLETARSQLAQARAQRAVVEHAIAALVGESPSNFAIASRLDTIALPHVPPGLPSTLLQRRPDIAAAQRRVAAANASIGVARTAYFPALSLSAAFGYQSISTGNWLTAPSNFWSIGPGMLFQLFDGGRRKAQLAQAEAVLNETGARYRGVVLEAFQQVEDSLVRLHHYQAAADAEQAAAEAAQKSMAFAMNRYREGAANYLEVTAAQTQALETQRAVVTLKVSQLRTSVELIRALGGDWQQAEAAGAVKDGNS